KGAAARSSASRPRWATRPTRCVTPSTATTSSTSWAPPAPAWRGRGDVDRVLVWGDQFELDLPGGWRLGDATETIEAYSELGDGAVHFSVINPVGRSWVPEEVA